MGDRAHKNLDIEALIIICDKLVATTMENQRRWLFFLLITCSVLWFSGYVQNEVRTFRPGSDVNLADFRVYYTAGLVARSDGDRRLYSYKETPSPDDPYRTIVINPQLQFADRDTTFGRIDNVAQSGMQYLYPPIFALIISPITILSPEQAIVAWHLLLFVFACAAVVLTVKLFYDDHLVVAAISMIAIVVLESSHPMRDLLFGGNIGSLLLILIVLGVYLHKRSPVAGSLFFALAVSIKLTPIVILPLMLIRRQWTWSIAFTVWSVLLFGISIWFLGWENHYEFFVKLMPAMSEGAPVSGNRSFSTFLYAVSEGRFLTIDQVVQGVFIFPPRFPVYFFKSAAVISFVGLLGFIWFRERSDRHIEIEIYLVILWSLIFSPVSFRHQYVLAMAPLLIAWIHPLTYRSSSAMLLCLAVATIAISSFLPSYAMAFSNSFVLELAVFMIMPVGVLLCGIYLFKMMRRPLDLFKEN